MSTSEPGVVSTQPGAGASGSGERLDAVDPLTCERREWATAAATARAVLARAAGMGCRCERCAAAAMTDGECRKCRVTFKGGKGKPWGT